MELEDTWQEFASLSPEAQREVADFISLLKQRDRSKHRGKQRQQGKFLGDRNHLLVCGKTEKT